MLWTRTAWWAGRARDAERHANSALELVLAEPKPDATALAEALAQAATAARLRGRPEWRDLFDRAVALEAEISDTLLVEALPRTYRAIRTMEQRDDLDLARSYLVEIRDLATDRGDDLALASALAPLAQVEAWAGNLDLATRIAADGLELARRMEHDSFIGTCLSAAALAAAYAGRADEARALAEEALERLGAVVSIAVRPRSVLAFVDLSVDRPEAALAWVEATYADMQQEGFCEPSAYAYLPDQVEALVRLGRLDDAERVLAPFERAAAKLGSRWSEATAARCRGLVLASRGELDAALARLDEAVVLGEALAQPFELGRALLVQGTVARRAKRKARAADALERAHSTFAGLGNALWTRRAAAELSRIGLGPSRTELTATEQRIAELVASGHSNPQIATALFMSRKTVEAHLTHCYRKLGIRSRAELAARYAGQST
jgi:DNA-binding CsgD family transcriptional regulator